MPNFDQNAFNKSVQAMMQQGGQNPQAFVQGLLNQNPRIAQQLQGKNVQQEAANILLQMGYPPEFIRQKFPNARI